MPTTYLRTPAAKETIRKCLALITANKNKSLDKLLELAIGEGFLLAEFQAAVKQYIDSKT